MARVRPDQWSPHDQRMHKDQGLSKARSAFRILNREGRYQQRCIVCGELKIETLNGSGSGKIVEYTIANSGAFS